MILRLEEIDSTNNYAKEHIDTLSDKTVVQAYRQTNGRGRLNRNWVDFGNGNLFFSIVLKPFDTFQPVLTNITQYACIILCKIFEKYGLNPKIKWPNDVMIDGKRKISGILSETVVVSGKLKGLIVGIGVNLSAKEEDVSSIQERIVTSLNLETGESISADTFLEDFITEFFKQYDTLLHSGFNFIKEDYVKRNCFLNKDLNIQVLNTIKSGYAKDINDNGELLLQTNDDKELILNIGDIL